MSLLALIGKGALVTLGAGAIITPIAIKLSSSSYQKEPIVIENFPQELKKGYKDNCQLLAKDSSEKKYLLVCDSNREERDQKGRPEFVFYSGTNKPANINEFMGKVEEGKQIKVTFSTYSWGEETQGVNGVTKEESILVSPPAPWADILEGVGLQKCSFKNNSWVVECEKSNGDKKDIYLTPLRLNS